MKNPDGTHKQSLKEKIEFLLTINKTKVEILEAIPELKKNTLAWYLTKIKKEKIVENNIKSNNNETSK